MKKGSFFYLIVLGAIIAGNVALYYSGEQTSEDSSADSGFPSSTLWKSGYWTSIQGNGAFTEMSTSGAPEFSFSLLRNAQHFSVSFFNDDKNMPHGSAVPIQLSFNDGATIPLTGAGSSMELSADLPDDQVAAWTHHFTADQTMTVSFPGSSEPPWKFQLAGTTATITALAKAIEAAGITGLPAPWSAAGYSTNAPATPPSPGSTSDGSIPDLTQPYGQQDVWQGPIPDCSNDSNSEDCLKKAMIAANASPQAIAFAAKFNFDFFLSEFQQAGKVSSGIITNVGAANNNDQPVLLNGNQPIIQVWQLPAIQNMDLSEIKKTHPNAETFDHPPSLISANSTSDGGQDFVYDVTVSDCHVCDLAEYSETISFDSNGNLVGTKSALLKMDTD
jgi:hypothetical protein